MENSVLTCARTRWIDLVDYLASMGYQPQKISGHDYWYLSPLRDEKHPSFKVNRTLNLWYDHGMGKGGNFLDFGLLYHRCPVAELLQKISSSSTLFSFQPQQSPEQKTAVNEEGRLTVLEAKPIQSVSLKTYLQERKIPLSIACRYCNEVSFALHGKEYSAIGLKNRSGGYELRNSFFKGSSAPKEVTYLQNGGSSLAVFEGFFSFLSYQTLMQKEDKKLGLYLPKVHSDFLILNSLSMLERSRHLIEKCEQIHLFLDRDEAGMNAVQKALNWSPKYRDRSALYKGYKDCNEYLVWSCDLTQKHRLRQGRHL